MRKYLDLPLGLRYVGSMIDTKLVLMTSERDLPDGQAAYYVGGADKASTTLQVTTIVQGQKHTGTAGELPFSVDDPYDNCVATSWVDPGTESYAH